VSTIDSGHYGDCVARRTKRLWTDEEKRSICFQTAASGVSVAQVARRYAVNANLIFKWLRDPRYAPDPTSVAPPAEEARFLPVEIVAETRSPAAGPVAETASRSSWRAVTGCGSAAAMIPRRWRG
jgi:transposase